ncbi:MAG: Unknown protein [uncultured Sulfurovum sp.]|uniref:Membrane protein, exporter n=1 Tax=uncultured Sulfurovum sp. TaxID=269237 RepID=A0A6S6T5S0_9BACT|nr:MAG: Unknown protein [uncultured Sulfurovum sp.]
MKYHNFLIFIVSCLLLIIFQSYTQLSTSLLSVLPKGESKALIKSFEQTNNAKVLLLTIKGFDAQALVKIRSLEKALLSLSFVAPKTIQKNDNLEEHQKMYKILSHNLDEKKLSELEVSKSLQHLYEGMTSSFFPVHIDPVDPFELLDSSEEFGTETVEVAIKNGQLILPDYGYLTVLKLSSQSLEEHRQVYQEIHALLGEEKGLQVFSPLFYYVENSQVIMSDVNKIIWMALALLLVLYLYILKDFFLLVNTLMTLGTSAMVATIVLAQLYDEVSVFVFVFGISVSTIAIDYMFHHYVHGYYDGHKKEYNREVLFGFLTTISAFLILSFSSFLLIQQITIFSMLSLSISYLHFAFLYPQLKFKRFEVQGNHAIKSIFQMKVPLVNVKFLFIISILLLLLSFLWIRFDFDLKTLDYNNEALKEREAFFSKQLSMENKMTFAIKAQSIEALISEAKKIKEEMPLINLPLASLFTKEDYVKKQHLVKSLSILKERLEQEANRLGFKAVYFQNAYDLERGFVAYTYEDVQAYGIDIVKINDFYFSYGTLGQEAYQHLLNYEAVESLSLKEHFESALKASIEELLKLGLLALFVVVFLLYFFSKKSMITALIFLLFPLAMVSLYAYFTVLNILHLFMLFIILALGIDYAIYLTRVNDMLTKKAISYSLISSFAGFGVLVFSSVTALFSIGVVATIGIVAIFILLLLMKEDNNVS